jgi:MinD-like ATPase involved in chromosome partitioning or flagellar assembly
VVAAHDLGQSVLLVDANFQHPTLSQHFDAAGGGLADVLAGKIPLARAVLRTAVPNLDILPAGGAGSGRVCRYRPENYAALFEAARATYALTLVDTAGVMIEPQTQALIPETDGALFVARLYWSRRASIKAAIERIGHERISGFIANNTEYWLPEWLYRLV